MNPLTLSEVLVDATRLLESGEMNNGEALKLCETLQELLDREVVLCNSSMQREWLVAKAWSLATGSKAQPYRSNSRSKNRLAQATKILAAVDQIATADALSRV